MKRIRYRLLLVIAVFFLVITAAGCHKDGQPDQRGDADLRRDLEGQITVDGKSYVPKKNLTVILLIGVDHREDAETGGTRDGGQADFLQLLVIDNLQRTVRRLALDRDTMTEITVLGILGDEAGTRVSQLALSHGFGDGKEQSCELTVRAVSKLLLDSHIDSYISMNMDGISELNDYLGGVTVTLEDDFSEMDPAMTPGATLTLRGEQAEYYVRGRMAVGDGLNASRMRRQEDYISKLTVLLDQKVSQGQDAIQDMLDTLSPYLITDLGRGTIVNTAYLARDYAREEPLKISGEHEPSKSGFMQFFPDEDSIQETVLELFYNPVE